MECFKCKVKLSSDSKFCPRCGTIFSQDDVENLGVRKENEFLDAYFPKKKININFYNISVGYLFFHFLYAFYKKMYIEGIISLFGFISFFSIIIGGMNMFLNSMGFLFLPILFLFVLSIGIYVYYVLKFNDIYLEQVKNRINKIMRNNPNANDEKIFELCRKDRGNFLLPLIIVIVLIYLIII